MIYTQFSCDYILTVLLILSICLDCVVKLLFYDMFGEKKDIMKQIVLFWDQCDIIWRLGLLNMKTDSKKKGCRGLNLMG